MTGLTNNIYDEGTGNLKKIVRQHDNMTIWDGIDYSKHGQLTFSIKGGIKQVKEYYPETGYLKSVTASDMQSWINWRWNWRINWWISWWFCKRNFRLSEWL